jgi:hypothetical protein
MALGVDSRGAYYLFLGACSLISFVPPMLAVAHWRAGRRLAALEAAACVFTVMAAASRGLRRGGLPPAFALLHPLGLTVFIAIGLNSGARWHGGRGVEWRGRVYGKRKKGEIAS